MFIGKQIFTYLLTYLPLISVIIADCTVCHHGDLFVVKVMLCDKPTIIITDSVSLECFVYRRSLVQSQ